MNWFLILKWLKNPYVILAILVGSTVIYYESRIGYLKSKVNKQERTLIVTQQELIHCQDTNSKNLKEFETLYLEYYTIVNTLADAKESEKKANDFIVNLEKSTSHQINDLQSQIKNNSCIVDADNIQLLKKANNQDRS